MTATIDDEPTRRGDLRVCGTPGLPPPVRERRSRAVSEIDTAVTGITVYT